MQNKLLSKEKNQVKVQLDASPEEFQQVYQRVYQKNKNNFQVPGFRKGHVPLPIVEKHYGKEIFYDDTIREIFPDLFEQAIDQLDVVPVSRPEIDVNHISKEEGISIVAEFTVKPEVTLGAYQNLSIEQNQEKVTEEALEEAIKEMQDKNGRYVIVEDRSVNEGDMILLDFDGYVDGEPFPGGQAEDYSLVVGSGTFIEGFEPQLIGMKLEEEKDISLTFPESYHAEELAGKDVVFKVKIKEIKEKELPALDDEFAKDVSEFDTLDELKEDTRKNLQLEADKKADQQFERDMLDAIIENMQVDIPEVMIDNQVENMIKDMEQQMSYQGLTLDQYLTYTNSTKEALQDQMRGDALHRIQTSLAIEAIGKQEQTEVTEEELEADLVEMASQYNMQVNDMKEKMRPEDMEYYKERLISKKVIDMLKESNRK